MVVPVRTSLNMEKVKECVGNNLKLDINCNEKTLIVVGNNCNIRLSENSGLVRIVGNTCELKVQKGNGNIEYVGNKGRIIIGASVPEGNVSYVGNNGVITNLNSSSTSSNETCDCKPSTPSSAGCNFNISCSSNITVNHPMSRYAHPVVIPVSVPRKILKKELRK